ncbi:hypothetical protein V6N12_019785 [Hibiscus sabdariffa]|uniref:Uncharacterized protein n=1 Tax=Hibiscus sabdariffa TaxID=183260 RepID=A0ABR2B084_9ROSI
MTLVSVNTEQGGDDTSLDIEEQNLYATGGPISSHQDTGHGENCNETTVILEDFELNSDANNNLGVPVEVADTVTPSGLELYQENEVVVNNEVESGVANELNMGLEDVLAEQAIKLMWQLVMPAVIANRNR